ncbi:hypothetical protein K3495_g9220 [Podosphaera aphanis]|nr:hypothetical protein K3495_g9220 [Podosphaera aphanis]
MLQTVIDISGEFGHIFIVSLIGGFCATIFGAWFAITLMAVFVRYLKADPDLGNTPPHLEKEFIGLMIFISFAGYWITELIRNVMYASISAIYGSWYLFSQAPGGVPTGPTKGAFRRVISYNFGSICFGSLLVAFGQLHRLGENSFVQSVLFSPYMQIFNPDCRRKPFQMLSLPDVLRYTFEILNCGRCFFSEYGLSVIAIYGESYTWAALETWLHMNRRKINILVTKCLSNTVLMMTALTVAFLTTISTFLLLEFWKPCEDSTKYIMMTLAFCVGFQIANIILVPFKTGIDALFAAIAHNPWVLCQQHANLMQQMIQTTPEFELIMQPHGQVQTGLPGN